MLEFKKELHPGKEWECTGKKKHVKLGTVYVR